MAVPQRFYGPAAVPEILSPVVLGLQDGAIVKGLYVVNTTAAPVIVTAVLVPPSGTASTDHTILPAVTIDPYTTLAWDQSLPFNAADALWMVASAPGVNATWHGYAPGALDQAGQNAILQTVAPVLGPWVDFAGMINPSSVTTTTNPDGSTSVGLDTNGDSTPDVFTTVPGIPSGVTQVDIVLDGVITPVLGADRQTVTGASPLAVADANRVVMSTNLDATSGGTNPIQVMPMTWTTPIDPYVPPSGQVIGISLVMQAWFGDISATASGSVAGVDLANTPFPGGVLDGTEIEMRGISPDPTALTAALALGTTLTFSKAGGRITLDKAVLRLLVGS